MKKIFALVLFVIVTVIGMHITTNHMIAKGYSGELNPNNTMDVVGMQIAVLCKDHKYVNMEESKEIIEAYLMLDSFLEDEESI